MNSRIQSLSGHESPQHRRYLRELAAEEELERQAQQQQV
ncbi:hypothetical protein SynA1560_01986 [Synechococcus sp. A15-60]|nr:hypothetical protein SynA1560_01986 [Synechococcus sp. A15-60]